MNTELDEETNDGNNYDDSYYCHPPYGKSAGGNGASSDPHSSYEPNHGDNQTVQLDAATQAMIEEMQREVKILDPVANKHSIRLLNREIERLTTWFEPDLLEVDIPKPIKVMRKILVPTQRHQKFNFVGKLLGPGGRTLQNLISSTRCRIYILGKGSSRDKAREEELFASGDPKHAHFGEALHVKVEASGPPPVAYQKLAHVLDQLQYYLQPVKDDIYAQQMADMGKPIQQQPPPMGPGGTPPQRGGMRGSLMGHAPPQMRGGGPPRGGATPRGGRPSRGRGGLIQTPPGPPVQMGHGSGGPPGGPPSNYVTYPGYDYGNYGDYQQQSAPPQQSAPQYGGGHGAAPPQGPPVPAPVPAGGPPPQIAPAQPAPPPSNYGGNNAYGGNYSYGYDYQYNQQPQHGQGPPQRPPGPMGHGGVGKAPRGRGGMPARPSPY